MGVENMRDYLTLHCRKKGYGCREHERLFNITLVVGKDMGVKNMRDYLTLHL